MSDFKPTEEQQAIIDFACTSKENLLVNALAGAAKTTTLELICKALPIQPILSLAFNKRIADEMARRLPGHVTAKTMNSVGHTVWGKTIGRRPIVDTKKNYNILKAIAEESRGDEKEEIYEAFSEILRVVAAAKNAGYIPKECPGRALIGRDDFFEAANEALDIEVPSHIVDAVLRKSISQSYAGTIDFDDQIYMSTLFGGGFPQFPLVLGDEVQDFSPLNHAMLVRLVSKRVIGVGDPWQSIYGFRGAVTSSMSLLREHFRMTEMTLSISFRCPIAVVKNAHFRVPHMKWAPWAEEGEVRELKQWSPADIPDGSAIICRNNAPLFSCAMALIRAQRGVHLVGTDLGPSLLKTFTKLGPREMRQEEVLGAIDKWETEKLKKARNPGAISDKADCLRVFAGFGEHLGKAADHAEYLFNCKGPIQLLSGHKAKGLEWDTVYHLDPWRVPSKYATQPAAQEQEQNVKYVIETRAKRSLYHVTMEGLTQEEGHVDQ